ncbi:MAG: hypothetical protein RLZZ263_422 [Cyanobacteriota bacterium]|jgi:hypothetical protein
MGSRSRKSIRELSLREYALYRAICNEIEDLQEAILHSANARIDFEDLAGSMRDRRLLVEWLRELDLPPSSDYSDSGLSEEAENQLIAEEVE